MGKQLGKSKWKKTLAHIIILSFFCRCSIFEKSPNIILKKINLRDKKYKPVVYKKTGNAVANNSIHISIIPQSSKINNDETANIFIAISSADKLQESVDINCEMDSILEVVFKTKLNIIKNNEVYIDGKDTIRIKWIPWKRKACTKNTLEFDWCEDAS